MKTWIKIAVVVCVMMGSGCTTDAWRKMTFGKTGMLLDDRDRDYERCEREGMDRYGWFPETIAPELTPRFMVWMERCMEQRGYRYQAGGFRDGQS
ncbi:MAG: hypothetical protein ACREI9_05690 [Nitrospiraceae bacterium]